MAKSLEKGNEEQREDKGKTSVEETWKKELGIKDNSVEYTITEIENIVRKQDQSICNSLHKATKIFIFRRYGDFENPFDSLRMRLAQLEHERWIAYPKLRGWQILPHAQRKGETKDKVHKLHTDICHWNDIRDWSRDEQEDNLGNGRVSRLDNKALEIVQDVILQSSQIGTVPSVTNHGGNLCTNCGTSVPAEANFCPNCGTKL